ncbi:Nucleoporin Pom152 [Taphrina deformans PYCC 5710]|uniref:Nucleoporin Pom152 n=1 Tax=Taphrina deformans (strain PYCC 5710 / ATCC 11124 / CBS 356.35 / IMI 108563 / JCM 9778 / NBRC 8474) TaxID=1097556 RepID=R4X6T2_TAPDE|nr:Nucleoporin Pom152 [Taphrina deformans PYCC 5710]|eukprot:CCG80916.1 Nucleoporin Pom152 [Taphrina deformans PYCC 5710]
MSDGSSSKPIVNARDEGMLISETIADAPTQRFYATSLFVFLQALKFYDYIQLYGAPPSAETVFAIKWIGIDAAYLLLIPKLKIPWLSFKLTTSILQIVLFGLFNVCLSARIPVSVSGVAAALLKLVYDRELSVLEHNVKVSDILNNSSRILGKHTVNILPESTAKLNPHGACYCVDLDSKPIFIPIRLNSTIPMLVQYSRIDPDSNDVIHYNISGKRLKTLLKHSDHKTNVWDLALEATEPGLYRIDRVQDSSRLDVRLYRSQALVVRCPTATLVIPERLKSSPDRCTGEMDELSIRASGLPPLKVKYNRWIEGRERVSTIDSVKPVDYTSPLMVGHHEYLDNPAGQQLLNLRSVEDVLWARSRQVDVHLNSSLGTAGTWSYTIEEVVDACGNTINYSKTPRKVHQSISDGRLDLTKGDTQSPAVIEAPTYEFRVHERPRISFQGCNPEAPTKLLPGKDSRLHFNIQATDAKSLNVQLAIGEPDALEKINSDRVKQYKDIKLSAKNHGVTVTEAGTYTISGFSSNHCKGIIEMPSSCVVYTPAQPSLSVAFEPIQDKCAGSIGLMVDLSFTGSPPFNIAWKVSKDGKAMMHRKKIDRTRQQLRFTPDEAGHFRYEFISLEDSNYKGIELSDKSYAMEQTVYPLAGAAFVQKETKKCCIDDSVSVPVRLIGSGPWNLVYEVTHVGKRQRFELTNLKEALQTITTPVFKKGGSHTVTLVSIQDANGCKTPLEEMDTTIEVRRERPSAAFYTIDDHRAVSIIEGSTIDLPLRLTGDGPWTVAYETPDKRQTLRTSDRNAKLKIAAPGEYRILEVQDAYCPGFVDVKAESFGVQWYPRPRLSLPPTSANSSKVGKYQRREVCEGDEDTFEIEIFGAPPFSIAYERAHLTHKDVQHDKQSIELNAALPLVSIKTKTSPAGTWRYTFQGVSDARYDQSHDPKIEKIEVEQFVHSRPRAQFVDKEKTYNYCLEVDLAQQDADKVPIKLQGQAPFQARFRVKHELTGMTEYLTEVDIRQHESGLQVPKSMLTLGKHIVSIAEVTDANGCSRSYTEKDSRVFIVISEMPSILPTSSRTEFCVGDRLTYALQGSPPFKVEYQFNGAHKRATVSGPVFSRIAEQPGEFTILSLYDSASNCKVSVNGLNKVVHDIPSVRVSEGKNIIESIHEGDQAEIIFHLYGTPPFSLTYTRSESSKGRHNKVLETHSVSGIWEDKYIIHSSVAGTFAATEIHDAHCRISLQN